MQTTATAPSANAPVPTNLQLSLFAVDKFTPEVVGHMVVKQSKDDDGKVKRESLRLPTMKEMAVMLGIENNKENARTIQQAIAKKGMEVKSVMASVLASLQQNEKAVGQMLTQSVTKKGVRTFTLTVKELAEPALSFSKEDINLIALMHGCTPEEAVEKLKEARELLESQAINVESSVAPASVEA